MLRRVFVVDGHPIMRTGYICVLHASGIRVVGEFGTGEQALQVIEKVRPAPVGLGLNLTGEMDGIETLVRMKDLPDPPRVLVCAAYNLPEDLTSCFLAGADGFLHKSVRREEFLEAVRSVASGKPAWSPGEREGDPRSRIYTTPDGTPLTPRQREVLALVLRRYPYQEIADALHISLPTLKNHISAVFKKLSVNSRKELLERSQVSAGATRAEAFRIVLKVLFA